MRKLTYEAPEVKLISFEPKEKLMDGIIGVGPDGSSDGLIIDGIPNSVTDVDDPFLDQDWFN